MGMGIALPLELPGHTGAIFIGQKELDMNWNTVTGTWMQCMGKKKCGSGNRLQGAAPRFHLS